MSFPKSCLLGLALGLSLSSNVGCGSSGGKRVDDDEQPGGDGDRGDGDRGDGDSGDGDSGDGDVSWPVIEGDYNLEVSDNPLKVTLTYEEDRQASQRFGFEGGILQATGSDGTTYVLGISNEAMPYPQRISMTPIATLEGLPFEATPHGVRLEPEGFEFVAPVQLEVIPPSGETWPVERQIPLSIQGKEESVGLGLIEPDKENLTFSLLHFSKYVALLSEKGMNATLSESEVRSRFGGNILERMQSAAGELLVRERQEQLLGKEDGNVVVDIIKMVEQFEERVLKLRLDKAGESCAASKLAVQTLAGLERQRQLLDMGSSKYWGQFSSLIEKSVLVCMKEEYEICRDEHIITRILPYYIANLRQEQLLGYAPENPLTWPTWWTEAEEYVKKCLTFEVSFDSSVRYSEPDADLSMSETVTGRVKVQYVLNILMMQGDFSRAVTETLGLITSSAGTLTASGYSVADSSRCDTIDETTRKDGQFFVPFLMFRPGDITQENPLGNLDVTNLALSFAFAPNLSEYSYTSKQEENVGCGQTVDSGTEILSWGTTLAEELSSEYMTEEDGVVLKDFLYSSGDIIGTKTFTFGFDDGQVDMEGPVNVVVFHKPE